MRATKTQPAPVGLFEMANIRPKHSGLPMTIWVSERGRARYGPRIRVSLQHGNRMDPYDTASVTVSEQPRVVGGELSTGDFRVVQDHVLLNRETLLAYWEGELDTVELVERLRRLP